MDRDYQNKISWLILSVAVLVFVALLYVKVKTANIIQAPAVELPQTTIKELPTKTPPSAEPSSIPSSTPTSSIDASPISSSTYNQLLLINGENNSYNVTGAKEPLITIVEFGDFTCPYCRASFPIIRAISVKYQDKVQFIFRDRTPTERAIGLAIVSHCVGEQGQFWQIHDLLYQNQSSTLGSTPDDPALLALVERINIDQNKFATCINDRRYLNRVKKNTVDSEQLGIQGTPTWFINGVKFEGELDKANIEKYIDDLLEELTQTPL